MKIRSAFLLQVAMGTVPSLILLAVVPLVRSRLSLDAFAGFTVIVSTVGLLSILDGGLGRASTYFISMARMKGSRYRERAALLGGIVVGVGFAVLAMAAGAVLLRLLDGESLVTSRDAVSVLLFFLPAFVVASVLRGILEGQQRFAMSAALQLPHGTLIGIAPLFVLVRSEDLSLYAWIVGLARVVLVAALVSATGLLAPISRRLVRSVYAQAGRLFHYSKWLFFSNIVGLSIVYADRLAVTGYFNSRIVAAYVLPMELIARGQSLVGAFCSVVFPRLVTHVQQTDQNDYAALIGDAQGLVIAAYAAIGFVCVPIMHPLMGWWLGPALADQAAEIALVGIVGLALVSSAAVSMLTINSMGHTRQVAVLHAMELLPYLALLYLATLHASVRMLLAAWLLRLAIDALGMSVILRSLIGRRPESLPRHPDKAPLHWAMLAVLTGALLALIFRAPFMAGADMYWATAGAVCSIAAFVHFRRRLRAAVSESSATPSSVP